MFLARLWRVLTPIISTIAVGGIIAIGFLGLMVGPVCYSNPGEPHTICRIVRSQYVAAALLSVGVTVLSVLIAIVIIELYSRKIYEPRLASAGNIYKIKKAVSTDAANVEDKSTDLDVEEQCQNSTELHGKDRECSNEKSHIV